MTAESPKAPESKARMAWFLDDRNRSFLADRDGTGGRYDPVEASAPVGPETPHRHPRHRDAEEETGDLRGLRGGDPRGSAPAGRIRTEDFRAGGGR